MENPEIKDPQQAKSNVSVRKVMRKVSRGIFPTIAWIAVALWCVVFLLLILWAFVNSLKSYINFYEDPLFLPKTGKGYG